MILDIVASAVKVTKMNTDPFSLHLFIRFHTTEMWQPSLDPYEAEESYNHLSARKKHANTSGFRQG